ncbi:hypothetical protein SUGI_0009910 [Cryptomeria japonica]|nr:hypothetical protein SUGI_0009910 [Cryptomeria japonica]
MYVPSRKFNVLSLGPAGTRLCNGLVIPVSVFIVLESVFYCDLFCSKIAALCLLQEDSFFGNFLPWLVMLHDTPSDTT